VEGRRPSGSARWALVWLPDSRGAANASQDGTIESNDICLELNVTYLTSLPLLPESLAAGHPVTRFATTSWRLILRAASNDDAEAQLALALLCEAYWYPVYAYVRRLGMSPADAEDVTQGYFARFLEKGVIREVHRDHGRFRSFLLVSVRNYLNNERDRERAMKRGGGRRLVSLDSAMAEEKLKCEPKELVTPETLFERTWAETVVARVHERLEQESVRRGTRDRLLRLTPFLTGAEPGAGYAEIAREWGVSESAVRVALHRLRKRFIDILAQEIGRTVEPPAEVNDEVRYVLGLLQP
jgi:RNA polymerase sigma factor (sigma-70 family)